MLISRNVFARAFCVVFVCVAVFGGALSSAYSPYSNPVGGAVNKALPDAPQLPFDPNDYDFVIYNCRGGENRIEGAMQRIGITTFTVCDASNPVTAAILSSHDVLIVGWDSGGGNKSGLVAGILEQGVTGRVILSGHDTDYHVLQAEDEAVAVPFFIQEIDYVLHGGGTGMLVCADIVDNFSWLPASWAIESDVRGGANVSSFTQAGLDSGIFDGLTPGDMSNWGQSYHNTFTSWGIGFEEFELGNDDQEVVTIGTPISVYGFDFEKNDDVADGVCLSPGDEFTYTICWENTSQLTFYEAQIIDDLPSGATYPGGFTTFDPNDPFNPIPPDPAYDPETHTYTWELGTVSPDDTGCAEITVMVNEKSEPGMVLYNVAKLVSDGVVLEWDSQETYVCCWDTVDPNIIYVDENATGNDNGTSWDDAYTDLQRAIARATHAACQVGPYTIYAAQGIYRPGDNVKDTFILPPNISMYGGFKAGGSPFEQRNPDRYETTLTGYIGLDANNHILRNETVVMMGHNALLDGFIVTEGDLYGIYGEGVDFVIKNCSISKNGEHGLYIEAGDVVIKWCKVEGSNQYGIRHIGAGYTLTLDNCQIIENGWHGMYTDKSTPLVRNCTIIKNGVSGSGRNGIFIYRPSGTPVLYNNTIAYNANAGLSWVDDFGSGSDPNELDYPDIQNCILWYNNDGGLQLAGYEFTQYSCVYDPNDAGGTDYTLDGFGNFSGNPGFAYENDPNFNVHLAFDSPCKDKGSPYLSYTDQMDIDSEDRIAYGRIDIGADEAYSCNGNYNDDIYNPLDWNADGIINFDEFAQISGAWGSRDPNDPSLPDDPNLVDPNDFIGWSAKCDFDSNYNIGLGDLAYFVYDGYWLWTACWKQAQMNRLGDMIAMGMGGGESMPALSGAEGMMTESYAMESSTVDSHTAVNAIEGYQPPTLEQSAAAILDYVNRRIEENHPNTESLYHMKAFLEDTLKELRKKE